MNFYKFFKVDDGGFDFKFRFVAGSKLEALKRGIETLGYLVPSYEQCLEGMLNNTGYQMSDLHGHGPLDPEAKAELAQYVWKMLGDVPVNDDGNIQVDFFEWPIGTHREEIWHDIEEKYDVLIHELMYPQEHVAMSQLMVGGFEELGKGADDGRTE